MEIAFAQAAAPPASDDRRSASVTLATTGSARLPDLSRIAAGIAAASLLRRGIGVRFGHRFVGVDDRVRAQGDDAVFASGDRATSVGARVPKSGMHALRQGRRSSRRFGGVFETGPARARRPRATCRSVVRSRRPSAPSAPRSPHGGRGRRDGPVHGPHRDRGVIDRFR